MRAREARGRKESEKKRARAFFLSLYSLLFLSHHTTHTWEMSLMTSRLSRFARNQEDWANRKSPARTATRVPYSELTVVWPVESGERETRGRGGGGRG